MNDEERRQYVLKYQDYRNWINMALMGRLIEPPDAAARLRAIQAAFTEEIALPDIRDFVERPPDFDWSNDVT